MKGQAKRKNYDCLYSMIILNHRVQLLCLDYTPLDILVEYEVRCALFLKTSFFFFF